MRTSPRNRCAAPRQLTPTRRRVRASYFSVLSNHHAIAPRHPELAVPGRAVRVAKAQQSAPKNRYTSRLARRPPAPVPRPTRSSRSPTLSPRHTDVQMVLAGSGPNWTCGWVRTSSRRASCRVRAFPPPSCAPGLPVAPCSSRPILPTAGTLKRTVSRGMFGSPRKDWMECRKLSGTLLRVRD
jgi:hypothetical protein